MIDCVLVCVSCSARGSKILSSATTTRTRWEIACAVGITGAVELDSLDGPIVLVKLSGRFWHKRATVLRNCRTYLMQRIPELSDVDLADPDDELDLIYDDETGELAEDRRAPDWNGDRDALTYQGIDPDMRGPFPGNVGGLRPGGSIFS